MTLSTENRVQIIKKLSRTREVELKSGKRGIIIGWVVSISKGYQKVSCKKAIEGNGFAIVRISPNEINFVRVDELC